MPEVRVLHLPARPGPAGRPFLCFPVFLVDEIPREQMCNSPHTPRVSSCVSRVTSRRTPPRLGAAGGRNGYRMGSLHRQ